MRISVPRVREGCSHKPQCRDGAGQRPYDHAPVEAMRVAVARVRIDDRDGHAEHDHEPHVPAGDLLPAPFAVQTAVPILRCSSAHATETQPCTGRSQTSLVIARHFVGVLSQVNRRFWVVGGDGGLVIACPSRSLTRQRSQATNAAGTKWRDALARQALQRDDDRAVGERRGLCSRCPNVATGRIGSTPSSASGVRRESFPPPAGEVASIHTNAPMDSAESPSGIVVGITQHPVLKRGSPGQDPRPRLHDSGAC
jgi:hypothetical protein